MKVYHLIHEGLGVGKIINIINDQKLCEVCFENVKYHHLNQLRHSYHKQKSLTIYCKIGNFNKFELKKANED